MASRAHTVVELVPYDPEWPARFAESAAQISAVLPEAEIEHVGSTSVPGLTSKDTIDLAVAVDDTGEVLDPEVLARLERHGYVHVPESFADDPDHVFLCRIIEDHRTDHVHVVRRGTTTLSDYLLFRDYLRAVGEAARRYDAAKADLAERHGDRRHAYVDEKQTVVDRLMVEAREWRQSTSEPAGVWR